MVPDHFFYLIRDNSSEKPRNKANNSQNFEQDMTNFNDLESKLSEPLDKDKEISPGNIKNLYRFSQA